MSNNVSNNVSKDEANEAETTNDSFSFVESEHNIIEFWKENDTFQRSLQQTSNSAPYIFYDGPPFATGLPHHGHLVGSILKDAVPRYFTMKGFHVQRRFGWDCHGLPIEHEIDKSLGMSSHEAVEKLGIKGYNDECRSIVQRYTSQWKETITRIGRWVDFDHDYKTMEPWYMESVWWVVKQLWEKDYIYQGVKVVPFSTALGTVLSNFEAGSNYQDVQDPAVTILFKLKHENTYIAAWTTTPWTLPSNLALCVGADIDYVKVKDTKRNIDIVVARDRLDALHADNLSDVLEEFKGSDLVGTHYEPIFPYFSQLESEGAFQILADDYVSTESGTGIVHQAPAFGEDDFRILKSAGITAMVCPIDMDGCFTAEVSDFSGQHVKDADRGIIKHLKESGALYHQDVVVHSYPFCPRSDTPIIYRTVPSWFVKVEQMRDRLVAVNEQINWVPNHIQKGRMGNWLAAANDWAISRNRYWGTPLPIWINDETGNRICIGSRDELHQYTGVMIDDLHREHVDDLSFTLEGESGTYRRIEEVLDCWFESGSMPYAQLHYPFENEALFQQGFPAEFIAEGLDQTRGWFYTLIVLGTCLFDQPAFKNVVVNGIVMAGDGKKMSKRLKNYTAPDELMEEYGADALRLYLINSGLVKAEEQRFTDSGVKDMVRRALLPWLNAFKFLQTYAEIDDWDPSTVTGDLNADSNISENIVDRWILSRLQSLKVTVAEEMEQYKLYNVVPALFKFIEDLTNWYIRLNRARFWADQMTADKQAAYQTLYTAIYELSLSMAPFAPFLSEYIYLQLKTEGQSNLPESVHLCSYPEAHSERVDPLLEQAVERMQNIILLGRQKRNLEKIKTKVPLSMLTIIHEDKALLDEISLLEDYIKAELNVKQVNYSTREDDYINFYAKPNSPVLGKRLGKEFRKFKTLIEQLDHNQLNQLGDAGSLELDGEVFSSDDILVFREAKAGTQTLSNRFVSIDLNCDLNQDLIAEGLAREVVNRVQKTRKVMNLNVTDRISVAYTGSDELREAIEKHLSYIRHETLSNTFLPGDVSSKGFSFDIDAFSFRIEITRIESK